MLVKEQWGIENVPFWHYLMLIPSYCKIFVSPDSWKHASNYSQYFCRIQINLLSLIFTDSWTLVKILEPNCLPRLSNCKIVKTTVQLLFSLFLQFSAIEIRSVFSRAKLTISWLKRLEKKLGVPELISELYPFFNWQNSLSRQIHYVFNVCVHEGALVTP